MRETALEIFLNTENWRIKSESFFEIIIEDNIDNLENIRKIAQKIGNHEKNVFLQNVFLKKVSKYELSDEFWECIISSGDFPDAMKYYFEKTKFPDLKLMKAIYKKWQEGKTSYLRRVAMQINVLSKDEHYIELVFDFLKQKEIQKIISNEEETFEWIYDAYWKMFEPVVDCLSDTGIELVANHLICYYGYEEIIEKFGKKVILYMLKVAIIEDLEDFASESVVAVQKGKVTYVEIAEYISKMLNALKLCSGLVYNFKLEQEVLKIKYNYRMALNIVKKELIGKEGD